MVARLLRGTLPVMAVLAAATGSALPARAQAADMSGDAAATLTVTRASEWWLAALHVPAAWRAAPAKGKGIVVAVLSTGVAAGHPDLTGTVTAGPDFGKTGRKPGGPYWGAEGTAVASLIAGRGHGAGDAKGVTGVAPGAQILSVPVTLEYNDPLGSDPAVIRRLPAAIAAGIRYAVGHGARVIALPLDPGTFGSGSAAGKGAADGSPAERAAVRYALAHNVTLVAPAGDNGASTGTANYPAAYPGVIAVGATTRAGRLSPFTNTGSYVALTAPGSGKTPPAPSARAGQEDPAAGLPVAAPNGGYQPLASTDMAAALTAGVAALIRVRFPSLTAAEVTQALEKGATARPAGGSAPGAGSAAARAGWGHGALNAAGALTAAAAIAAARPAGTAHTAVPSASQPAAGQRTAGHPAMGHQAAGSGHGRTATAARPDPAGTVRAILIDIVIAVGALIAALITALAIAMLRRQRAARPARPARVGRPGPQGSHARRGHALSAVPRSLPLSRPPALPPPPALPRRAALPAASQRSGQQPPGQLPPGQQPPGQLPPGQLSSGQLSSGRQPPGQPVEQPPWGLAPRSGPGTPPLPLSAPRPAGELLPPWEQTPADFIPAPPDPDAPPWPISNTGPMYVWNPATATGPLPKTNRDKAE